MDRLTFRSTFNRVLCTALWILLGAATVAVVLAPGTLPRLSGVALAAAGAAALVWALLWSPHLTIDDAEVRAVNVLSEVTIPWAALIHVDTRYALTLHTPARRTRVTAAPAPGQLAAFRAARGQRERLGRLTGDALRPGDLPHTDSGRAAELVRTRWETLRDEGRIEAGEADRTPVRVRLRPGPIVAIVVGTTALVIAALTI